MKLALARELAGLWIDYLADACERIEIAGSIRRGKAEPKDIELLAVPKFGAGVDLLGDPTRLNLLEERVRALFWDGAYTTMTKNGTRYKQIVLDGIKLDLFIVLPPAEWGVQHLIRTGPADFSTWAVTPRNKGGRLPSYLRVKDGAIWHRGTKIETPEEADVFRILGLDYIEPAERRARWRVSA